MKLLPFLVCSSFAANGPESCNQCEAIYIEGVGVVAGSIDCFKGSTVEFQLVVLMQKSSRENKNQKFKKNIIRFKSNFILKKKPKKCNFSKKV